MRISAFIGYRPPDRLASQVAAPPYDVISSDEARELAKGNPISFLHVNKPEIDLDPSIDLYADAVYETARKNLDRFIAEGVLAPDPRRCLYAYRQRMGSHVQLGLMCCAHVDDYDEDRIKKHEKTRQDKEDDRARHVDVTNCNAGPVFLTYRARPEIDAPMRRATAKTPEVDFVSADGIQHTLWVISDPALIGELIGGFARIDVGYVADGHHRAKSGSRVRALRRQANPKHTGVEEYNWFLTVYFPHDQLQILDYNRVVADLNGLTEAQFLEKVQEKFDLSPAKTPKPPQPTHFGMYLGGKWRRLVAKAGSYNAADPVQALDVSILQNNLLDPILGIGDPRKDKRIDFVGGIRGAEELEKRVQSGKGAVAFAMHPTTLDQLMAISDAGQVMPPKSTWFEPKLKSGLVVHLLG
ncbi:MAG: DUF1015 domain-containing protein [Myxococcales bacterium]|nr:MAG: DUF1015 domain-containing protein [Myxococcales bacterium]